MSEANGVLRGGCRGGRAPRDSRCNLASRSAPRARVRARISAQRRVWLLLSMRRSPLAPHRSGRYPRFEAKAATSQRTWPKAHHSLASKRGGPKKMPSPSSLHRWHAHASRGSQVQATASASSRRTTARRSPPSPCCFASSLGDSSTCWPASCDGMPRLLGSEWGISLLSRSTTSPVGSEEMFVRAHSRPTRVPVGSLAWDLILSLWLSLETGSGKPRGFGQPGSGCGAAPR